MADGTDSKTENGIGTVGPKYWAQVQYLDLQLSNFVWDIVRYSQLQFLLLDVHPLFRLAIVVRVSYEIRENIARMSCKTYILHAIIVP